MIDITKPDNAADTVVTITISGNALVSVLNTAQALMYETGRTKLTNDGTVGTSESYERVNQTVERIRDQLSDQRCARNRIA